MLFEIIRDESLTLEQKLPKIKSRLKSHPQEINKAYHHARRTALHLAALKGYRDIVEALLIAPDVWIEQSDWNGQTALHFAAIYGHTDIVNTLLTFMSKNEINEPDIHNRTPLYHAVKNDHRETVKKLIENGANINTGDCIDNMPLHFASQNGHIETVRLLLSGSVIDINQSARDGRTALHLAVVHGHTNIIEALLAIPGIQINQLDRINCTPLHCAVMYGRPDAAIALIKKGADFSDAKIWTAVIKNMESFTQKELMQIFNVAPNPTCRQLMIDNPIISKKIGYRENDSRTPLLFNLCLRQIQRNPQAIAAVTDVKKIPIPEYMLPTIPGPIKVKLGDSQEKCDEVERLEVVCRLGRGC